MSYEKRLIQDIIFSTKNKISLHYYIKKVNTRAKRLQSEKNMLQKKQKSNRILYEYDENQIRDVLLWHKIIGVERETNTLSLDNGLKLAFSGNEGCGGCASGWYEITELNGCDNVITNVEFVCDEDTNEDYNDTSYKIFVYAEDTRIKLLQVDGSDGNGYYGTGYTIYVKVPTKEIMEELKMARKEEIKDYLEYSGFEKSDMKAYWKLLAEHDVQLPRVITIDLDDEYESESASCAELRADGVKWKMLPMDIIQLLPELAEPYLHDAEHVQEVCGEIPTIPPVTNAERESADANLPGITGTRTESVNSVARTTSDVEESALNDFEREVLHKLDNGQELTEQELRTLAYEYADEAKRKYGDNDRWTRPVSDIIEIGNRYYSLTWREGLTEMQEDESFAQPERVYPTRSMHLIERVRYIPDREAANDSSHISEVERILEDNGLSIAENGEIHMSEEYEELEESEEELEM